MITRTIASAMLTSLFAMAASPAFAQTCTPAQPCGDINASETVTIVDALSVLRRSLDLPVSMSCSCNGGEECPAGGVTESRQVQCWNPLDITNPIDPIDCPGTGQDGEFRWGLLNSFVDNGDGTITDQRTTLQWEKLSDDDTIHDYNNSSHLWPGAFQKVAALNAAAFAGHNDWRLPQVRELTSIIDYSKYSPTIAPLFDIECKSLCTVTNCSCTLPLDYWTSTTYQQTPSSAWYVAFRDGSVVPGGAKTSYKYVRAVRGGY